MVALGGTGSAVQNQARRGGEQGRWGAARGPQHSRVWLVLRSFFSGVFAPPISMAQSVFTNAVSTFSSLIL